VVATPGTKSFDDPSVFVPLPLVNRIRPRVEAWREAGYPGVTGTTLRLLQHWRDPETWEARRFFFCQLEAIETLIWLAEAPAGDRQGIEVPGDGGPFTRLCAKMATGSGKTLHVNRCVFDSTWEASEAFALDRHPDVAAWVKNDHLGFEIVYVFDGLVKKYRTDYLVRLTDGTTLILEVKGQESAKDQTKRRFVDEWVRAVNAHGGFGGWAWVVSRNPSDVSDCLAPVAAR
jgi:hypothetical protein